MKRVLCALIFCLVCVLAVDVNAQTWPSPWPSRPLKLIVPTGPGAATDVMARMLADGVSRKLDQPMVVENMPGASGIVAHQTVARAAPDGYTFLFTNTSGLAINLISFKQLPYDPTKDFTAVAMVCNQGPGKVRRITITSKTRFRGLPDLPAVSETLSGIAVDGFFAIVAPAGTPADIVARLNREIAEYLKSPEIQQRLISFGLATEGAGTPAGTAQFIRNEQDHWRALAQELDVEPQ
jgi:tripartite-type tricarboxylate transporter receptor subunit TctC